MGDVEDTGLFADSGVLGEDGGILHRHRPATEGDELGAEGKVGGFERRVEDCFGHGWRLLLREVLVNRARLGKGCGDAVFG